jgi:Flp pilus assembly CpaF family ATPase
MTTLPPRPSRPSLGGGGERPGLPGRPARPTNPIFSRPAAEPQPEEPILPVLDSPEEEAWEQEPYVEPAAEELYPATEDGQLYEPETEGEYLESGIEEDDPYVASADYGVEETEEAVYEPLTNEELAEEVEDELTEEDRELQETIASFTPEVREAATRLLALIVDDSSTEVLLNGPNKIMFKQQGVRYLANITFPDIDTYHKVINAVILSVTDTPDRLGVAKHQIEGPLFIPDPEGGSEPLMSGRVHIMAPPAVKVAQVTIAKKSRISYRIDDLAQGGSMSYGMAEFLKALARGRATIVISGGTGSGKTTLLEALSHEFDENDRVAIIENTPELRIPLADVVPMRATSRKPDQDENAVVTLGWLVEQANKMRMDRIIVGEIQGGEMADFLNAANSGVEGSMTTIHADTPALAIEKMRTLAQKNPAVRNGESVYRDVANTVHVIVQATLIDNRYHRITEITEVSNTVSSSTGQPQMAKIFEYKMDSQRHVSPGQPSARLKNFLTNRGANVDPNWFTPRG